MRITLIGLIALGIVSETSAQRVCRTRRVVRQTASVNRPTVVVVEKEIPVVVQPPAPILPSYGPNWRAAAVDYLTREAEAIEFRDTIQLLAGGSGNPGTYGQSLPIQGGSLYGAAPIDVLGSPIDSRDVLALLQRQQDLASNGKKYQSEAEAGTKALIGQYASTYSQQQETATNSQSASAVIDSLRQFLGELQQNPQRVAPPAAATAPRTPLASDSPAGQPGKPLLVDHFCSRCHSGNDAKKGFEIMAGISEIDSAKALARLVTDDEDQRMPPVGENQPSRSERIELMREIKRLTAETPPAPSTLTRSN